MNIKPLKFLHGAGLGLALAGSALAQTPQQIAPAQQQPAQPPLSNEQASYLIGINFGNQIKNAGLNKQISADAMTRGMKEALAGKQITPAEQQQIQAWLNGVAQAAVVKNNEEAKAFLAKNKSEKGVVTTASGLQYKVIAPGDKKAPQATVQDEVTVQYRGKLLDGTEFDSSYARGQPATFPVNGVIKGWQEAIVLMRPGAKYQLFVPPDLAYGDRGQPKIPGGSLLIFDVELLQAKNAAAPAAAPPGTPGAPKPH
jgi:FKBP-type peptidyl-prolyl cis-trans isomerase FklB